MYGAVHVHDCIFVLTFRLFERKYMYIQLYVRELTCTVCLQGLITGIMLL